MTVDLPTILKNTSLKALDIQRAGCVVVQIPLGMEPEAVETLANGLKTWAEGLGINILMLPAGIDVSVIPRENITPSSLHARVEILEKQLQALLEGYESSESLVSSPTIQEQ